MTKSRDGKLTPDDRRRDGERALAEQRAEADAVNKNMARLRALRLERESSAPPPEKEVKKPEKKQPESLARYLKHQKAIDRNT